MNNLKEGKLDLGKFSVCPNTNFKDIKENFQEDDVLHLRRLTHADLQDVNICGTPCFINLSFKGRISKIEIHPYIKTDKKFPDEETQNEKYALSTKILDQLLSAENKETGSNHTLYDMIIYKYEWGYVSCYKVIGGKGMYTGGNINIWYYQS